MDPSQDHQVWNIFEMPPQEIATVYKQDLEIKTEPATLSGGTLGLQQTQSGTIRLLTRDLDSWLLPSEARLQVRFRIADANGYLQSDARAYAAGPPVVPGLFDGGAYPITLINGGWNIFKDMEIKLNGKSIERVDQPGKVHLMHGYASYSAEYVKQCQDLEWFYPECAVQSNGDLSGVYNQVSAQRQLTGFANAIDNENQSGNIAGANQGAAISAERAKENKSFKKRFARTRKCRTVELWLPLSAVSGFCKENTRVIRGMTMEVSLNRNTEFNSILHAQSKILGTSLVEGDIATANYLPGSWAALNPYLLLDSVSLWIPELKPSLAMASHIEQQLASDAATKWVFSELTTFQSDVYQQNTSQLRWQITSSSHRPTLALVGFQSLTQTNLLNDRVALTYVDAAATATALPGDPVTWLTQRPQHACANAGMFSSLGNITNVEFRVNGRIVPNESYQISFLNETYKRAYYDFRKVFHKDDPTEASIYDEVTYRDSPIFAFDLRAIGDEGIYQNIKTNNLEFRATLVSENDGTLANGAYGTGAFQVFCVLVSEKEASVESKGGRLSIMP